MCPVGTDLLDMLAYGSALSARKLSWRPLMSQFYKETLGIEDHKRGFVRWEYESIPRMPRACINEAADSACEE